MGPPKKEEDKAKGVLTIRTKKKFGKVCHPLGKQRISPTYKSTEHSYDKVPNRIMATEEPGLDIVGVKYVSV